MSRHEPFNFRSSAGLLEKASGLGIELPFQQDLSPLFEDITLGSKKIANRLSVQPLEGYDANPDGSPSDLTFRRYKRFAGGGSALIWFEATSVVSEGRSNPRQLWIHTKNVGDFASLVAQTREQAIQSFGPGCAIFCVLQLTHSGRYSRPDGMPRPHIAVYNPILDENKDNLHVFSDDELDFLQERFVDAACLACQAGFDAVDLDWRIVRGRPAQNRVAAGERRAPALIGGGQRALQADARRAGRERQVGQGQRPPGLVPGRVGRGGLDADGRHVLVVDLDLA